MLGFNNQNATPSATANKATIPKRRCFDEPSFVFFSAVVSLLPVIGITRSAALIVTFIVSGNTDSISSTGSCVFVIT